MNFLPRPREETTTAAKIAALGAVITGAWDYIHNAFIRATDVAVVRTRLSPRMSEPMLTYFRDNFRRQEFGRKSYVSMPVHVRSRDRIQLVAFRNISGHGEIYWDGNKPIHVEPMHDDGTGGLDLQYLRGTFDLEELIQAGLDYYNRTVMDPTNLRLKNRRPNRFFIRHITGTDMQFAGPAFGHIMAGGEETTSSGSKEPQTLDAVKHMMPLGYTWDDLGAPMPAGNPFDHLSLTEEQEIAIEEIRRWAVSGDWFRERSVPWKRGLLLAGPPGTGKSATVRALAQDLGIPIYNFDLQSLDNEDMRNGWEEMSHAGAPVIALMEDIDAVFDGRENSSEDGALSFDCLLNCIDGVEETPGVLTIITSNHPEGLDPALVRPGRVDRRVEFGSLTKEGRWKLARRILAGFEGRWASVVAEGDGDTGAAFQERCARIALDMFWSEQTFDAQATRPLEEAK